MHESAQVDGRSETAGLDHGEIVDAISQGCLGCALVTDSPVSLHDGTVVCSDCPEWRHECEVRYVAEMASKAMRVSYLAGIAAKRGPEARQKIIQSLRMIAQENGHEVFWGAKTV